MNRKISLLNLKNNLLLFISGSLAVCLFGVSPSIVSVVLGAFSLAALLFVCLRFSTASKPTNGFKIGYFVFSVMIDSALVFNFVYVWLSSNRLDPLSSCLGIPSLAFLLIIGTLVGVLALYSLYLLVDCLLNAPPRSHPNKNPAFLLDASKRIRSIDILKGIAMIMVILVHYQQSFELCEWFDYLQMGCPIFFVCSGFGIVTLIHKKFPNVDKNAKETGAYLFSRFKALAPGWYLTIAIVVGVNSLLLYLGRSTLSSGTNREPLSIVINVLFLHGFFPFCNNNVVAGGWYIGTTAILYCLTPLVLFLMKKFKNRRIFFFVSTVFAAAIWFLLCGPIGTT